jgi:hypothetical protein
VDAKDIVGHNPGRVAHKLMPVDARYAGGFSQHPSTPPGRLFNPFHKWAVPQNLQVPAKPQKE